MVELATIAVVPIAALQIRADQRLRVTDDMRTMAAIPFKAARRGRDNAACSFFTQCSPVRARGGRGETAGRPAEIV
jgi:hypothetical protein